MNTNPEEIVQQIRAQMHGLLASVMQGNATAVQMERRLLTQLLALGRSLMLAFIMVEERKLADTRSVEVEGKTLPWHSRRQRALRTVFGIIEFARGYYYIKGCSHALLDAVLNLPTKRASDLLREWVGKLGCYLPYHEACQTVGGFVGQELSARELEEEIAEDAAIVETFYEQAPAPAPDAEQSILVVQADGKGVPMRVEGGRNPGKVRVERGGRKSRKKEAIATAVYTIAPRPRTPEEVTKSLFKEEEPVGERSGPVAKHLWATLQGKAVAAVTTAQQVRKRVGAHIAHRVALTDGCEALQKRVLSSLAGFVLVLDVIHAVEYLWKAANALLGETSPKREAWVSARCLQMLQGQAAQIITEFRQLAEAPGRKKLAKARLLETAAYFERNLGYMRYDEYLRQGWPIGTGVIEGACRHLIKDRCEQSGMRWTEAGADALLRLRCVAVNGDWDAFQEYRIRRRQETVYHGRGREPVSLEPIARAANDTEALLMAA